MRMSARPENITPYNTEVVLDFERSLTNHNLLMDIYRIYPLKATKALLNGVKETFVKVLRSRSLTNFKPTLVFNVKRGYSKDLDKEERRDLGRRVYQIDRRYGIEDLLHILEQDSWPTTLITSADRYIAEGFLGEFASHCSIIGTEGDDFIWTSQKEKIAKDLKQDKKYLICLIDCEIDNGISKYADASFIIGQSPLSVLFGIHKIRGKKIKSLYDLKRVFDLCYYAGEMHKIA